MFDYLEKVYDSPAELYGEVDEILNKFQDMRDANQNLIEGYITGVDENEILNRKITSKSLEREIYNLLFDLKLKIKQYKVYRVCVRQENDVMIYVKAETESEAEIAALNHVSNNFVGSMSEAYDDIDDHDTYVVWSEEDEGNNYSIKA